jgi:transcriptional regulator with XRE-family HTH domain
MNTQILQRLTQARKQSGLSQMDVARLMGYSASSTISHYEAGEREITFTDVLRLCKIYGVTVGWIETGEPPDFDPTPLLKQIEGDVAELLESLAGDE